MNLKILEKFWSLWQGAAPYVVFHARVIMTMSLAFVALTVLVSVIDGKTTPLVAFPIWALVSSGLVGLGLLRKNDLNIPALIGTGVAIVAATFWLKEVIAGELVAGTWENAVYSLVLFGGLAATAVVTISIGALSGVARADSLRRHHKNKS